MKFMRDNRSGSSDYEELTDLGELMVSQLKKLLSISALITRNNYYGKRD